MPIKNSCGLSIDLTQRATVQDWWVAYEAAKHLRAQKKTFSTISSVSLTPELENVLHEASVVRVRQQTLESVRAIAASVTLPAPNQIMAASELISPRAFNGSAVSSSLTSIKRWIEEAASISPTASTMGEIVTLALKIRSEVVALVSTLCAEAHARQLTYEESLYSAQWDTIMSGSADKAAVESAAKQIAAAPPKEPGTTQIPVEELLKKHLSTEYDAVEDALRSLSKVLESLPRDLYQQHLNQRLDLINRYAPAL